MKAPSGTYRLQFRNGMDFASAIRFVPYLRDLGVSHLYASPVFTALSGSTHGYDVTDHNEIDPALGGRAGFDRLARALRGAGLGLILDIVPNHMAASTENPWWRDVLEWGAQSRFSRHFDIDWTRKLTLPILGRPYEEALAAGELSLAFDADRGTLSIAYFDNLLPLHPASWEAVLAKVDHPLARPLAGLAGRSDPADPGWLHRCARELVAGTSGLDESLRRVSADHAVVDAAHAEQPWQLLFWKEARLDLSYRRFFEITGLVGVRVEDPAIFADVHSLTLELVRAGQVDGLRIDHVDGLADPGAYLRMLREAIGPDICILVEKILATDERLPSEWPVEGTTGYEFIDATVDLLADSTGLQRLSASYQEATGSQPVEASRREAKARIVTFNFAGELSRLAATASELTAPRFGFEELRAALAEMIVAIPVYRIYAGQGGASDADRAALRKAEEHALQTRPDLEEVFAFLRPLLLAEGPQADYASKLRILFQQLSGPAAAKGVEDTLFYRDHRLLALNEVGCEPDRPPPELGRFHHFMQERATREPLALSATATHDTKRGEDARARLMTLTEAPDRWAATVARWRAMHRPLMREVSGQPAPEPEVEWMIYQALVAAWPDEPRPESAEGLDALRSRFLAFLEKALREAKLRTSWTDISEQYEAAVRAYAEQLFEPDKPFLMEFIRETAPFRAAGRMNALTQTLVKMTAPGVPDIYQGTEGGDFSMVDPDNRRPIDVDRLTALMHQAESPRGFPEWKTRIIKAGLSARRLYPDLFRLGDYLPLEVHGPACRHLATYARSFRDDAAIVVAPRLVLDLIEGNAIPVGRWADTSVRLPEHLSGRRCREMLTGQTLETSAELRAAELLAQAPCALLVAD